MKTMLEVITVDPIIFVGAMLQLPALSGTLQKEKKTCSIKSSMS
jgi:hypothetical protein